MRKIALLALAIILAAPLVGCASGEETEAVAPEPNATLTGAIEIGEGASSGTINLTISEDGASLASLSVTLSELECDGFSAGSVTKTADASIPITEGGFQSSIIDIGEIEGEFTSSTKANGTINLILAIPYFGPCELGTWNWSAQKGGAAPDHTPPTISNISATDMTETSVTITWTTDEPSTSRVEYGETVSYGATTSLHTELVTNHSVTLDNLKSDTTYHFRVKSGDSAGNEATSGDRTFTTLALPDTTLPVISEVAVSEVTESSATITWTTDEPATSQVEYGFTTIYESTTTLDEDLVTSHSVTLSELWDSTTYHLRVKSRDASGNEATSGDYTFTTSDTSPPIIMRIGVSGVTTSTATITWTTNEPATSQVKYGDTIDYGFSTALDEVLVTSHSVTLSGLSAGTTYHFRMNSKDALGNEEVWERDYTFTTAEVGVPNVVVVGSNLFSTWDEWFTIDGEHNRLYIVGELRNDSAQDVRVGEITIRLYDSAGNVECKRSVNAFDTILRPGETTAFKEIVPSILYWEGDTNHFPTLWEFYMCSITFTPRYLVESDPTPVDVVIQDYEATVSNYSLSITGSVFNADQQTAKDVQVYAVLYGEDGRIINTQQDIYVGDIAPGESQSFQIEIYDEEPIDYASYIIKAYGDSS